jgi:hypothetical protein
MEKWGSLVRVTMFSIKETVRLQLIASIQLAPLKIEGITHCFKLVTITCVASKVSEFNL